ncbi:putative chitinase 10 [Pseudolycoriella hygida]|uniref:Chitinase 10 n=1 Tax=Pseudolycoriella hygida TaxID=35572 RepID=A0A9Q0N2S4_9DIPT|nr:putative chitinase 10 [Pseudolycoriella hygida]
MFFSRLSTILVANLILLQCSWVACSVCSDGDYTADPFDCNAFLQCRFGIWTRRNCPPELHFNPVNFACDFPWNANCVIDSTSTTITTIEPTEPTATTEIDPPITTSTSAPIPTTTTICPTTSSPTTTTTFPTVPPTISSPSPTLPTPTLPPTPPPTFPSLPPTTTSTFPPTTSTMPPTFPPSLACPKVDGMYVVHLPHPNCTMFYKCVHGVPHEMICPETQHWAMFLDRCEFEEDANCVEGAALKQPDARPPNYW